MTTIGIAGIMGGASSEISSSTTEIIIEVAWWDPPSISRSVKNLNLMSEASMRFRRGADYGINMERAIYRVVQLLSEASEPEVLELLQKEGNLPDSSPVLVRPTKVNRLLGTSIDDKTMTNLLKSIGFGVTANKETWRRLCLLGGGIHKLKQTWRRK